MPSTRCCTTAHNMSCGENDIEMIFSQLDTDSRLFDLKSEGLQTTTATLKHFSKIPSTEERTSYSFGIICGIT